MGDQNKELWPAQGTPDYDAVGQAGDKRFHHGGGS